MTRSEMDAELQPQVDALKSLAYDKIRDSATKMCIPGDYSKRVCTLALQQLKTEGHNCYLYLSSGGDPSTYHFRFNDN